MKSNLEEILEKANIIEIISQYVTLRKQGRNYVGLCPFHKEKTPSFTVSPEKQIYYCFGCHQGGNVVHFLMKHEGLTFQEALENLGEKYGVKIRRADQKRLNLYDALSRLSDHYHETLKSSRYALDYLLKRGISDTAIEEFRIGYSDRTDGGIKTFLKGSGIPPDWLLSIGVLRLKNNELYDIFRGRIIIPIMDVNKRVTGFGGRAIEKDGYPKYINSPESSIFSKGSSLFGIDKTKGHIVEKDEAIVVEGYFDLISLYTRGIKNVVATLGTAVTGEQLSRLRNYTENITLMLDGDEAGIKSTLRLISTFSDMDLNGNMVVLPEGHDPDSLIKKGGVSAIEEAISYKRPIIDYLFESAMAGKNMSDLNAKERFIRTIMPYINGIKSEINKRLYIKRLSDLTGVEEYYLFDGIKQTYRGPTPSEQTIIIRPIGRKVIGALFSRPWYLISLKEKGVIDWIRDEALKETLSRMLSFYEETGHLEVNSFIDTLEKDGLKASVLNAVFDVAQQSDEEMERALYDYLRYVERKSIKDKARQITERLAEAEREGDTEKVAELLAKKSEVLRQIRQNKI